MQTSSKHQGVAFEHDDSYRGNVTLVKGETRLTVPVEALRLFVAETVRARAIERLQAAKPEALLSQ